MHGDDQQPSSRSQRRNMELELLEMCKSRNLFPVSICDRELMLRGKRGNVNVVLLTVYLQGKLYRATQILLGTSRPYELEPGGWLLSSSRKPSQRHRISNRNIEV